MSRSSSSLVGVLLLSWSSIIHAQLYPICLVTNPGFSNCTPEGDQSTYSGIDVDLINYVTARMGWQQVAPGTNSSALPGPAYTLICTDRRVAPTIDILANTSSVDMSTCAIGAGAFTVTTARVGLGVRFSWPHVHSSLGVMVSATAQQTSNRYDRWAFLRPFSSQIWLAIFATAIITPVLLSLYENIIQTGRVPLGMHLITEWRHAIYTLLLLSFNLKVLEVLSLPCQVVIVCFAFTNLILVASYTANLAAVLTSEATTVGIQGLRDLVGRVVGAHSVYVDRLLSNERIKSQPMPWAGEPFFLKVKEQLVGGSLDAYIFDQPILTYYLGVYGQDCQLRLLKDTNVEPFDYGIAFHRLMPEEVVKNFSLGVLEAQSAGLLSILRERYISLASTGCDADSSYDNALQFAQVSGLYIVLGSAIGFGFLVSVYSIWWFHVYQPRLSKRRAAAEAAAALTASKHLSDLAYSEADSVQYRQGPEDQYPGSTPAHPTIAANHCDSLRQFNGGDGTAGFAHLQDMGTYASTMHYQDNLTDAASLQMEGQPLDETMLKEMIEEEQLQAWEGGRKASGQMHGDGDADLEFQQLPAPTGCAGGAEAAVGDRASDSKRSSKTGLAQVARLAVSAKKIAKKVFVVEGSSQAASLPPLGPAPGAFAQATARAASGLAAPRGLVRMTDRTSFISQNPVQGQQQPGSPSALPPPMLSHHGSMPHANYLAADPVMYLDPSLHGVPGAPAAPATDARLRHQRSMPHHLPLPYGYPPLMHSATESQLAPSAADRHSNPAALHAQLPAQSRAAPPHDPRRTASASKISFVSAAETIAAAQQLQQQLQQLIASGTAASMGQHTARQTPNTHSRHSFPRTSAPAAASATQASASASASPLDRAQAIPPSSRRSSLVMTSPAPLLQPETGDGPAADAIQVQLSEQAGHQLLFMERASSMGVAPATPQEPV